MNLAYFRIVWAIGSRQITRVVRKPQMLTPIFLVPTMFLVVTSGGAARAINLPGFPEVDSFFQFALAGAIIQSTMLGGLMTGIALSVDVDSGFFDRMIVAPIPRSALVIGSRRGYGRDRVVPGARCIWRLELSFGAPIEGGVLGVLIILTLAALSSASLGGLAVALSLRAQAQWVQGIFPLVFVIIFLSSAFFPRELLTGPAEAVAAYNPISYLAEGIRGPIIDGNSGAVELKAFAVGIGTGGLHLADRGARAARATGWHADDRRRRRLSAGRRAGAPRPERDHPSARCLAPGRARAVHLHARHVFGVRRPRAAARLRRQRLPELDPAAWASSSRRPSPARRPA